MVGCVGCGGFVTKEDICQRDVPWLLRRMNANSWGGVAKIPRT